MLDRPILILVNGAPATGKTTISRKLAKDLQIPRIGKDDIKEMLFDTMGHGDLAWSQDMGAGVSEMLFTFSEVWARRGRSLIAENAYYREFATPKFADIVRRHNVTLLEIYCRADPGVRRGRFVARNESGERHPGHIDQSYYDESDAQTEAKYAPIRVGDFIEVDTTEFSDGAYAKLLEKIRAFIALNQKEGVK